ncbi:MAG: multidrug resistance efflux pump, partial [Halieaceae bacterium]
FSAVEIERLEANVALVSVAFRHRRLAEMSFLGVSRTRFRRQLERLLAPGYIKRKVFSICLFSLVLFLALAQGEYRINADATLEPRQVRIISSPFGGYLKTSTHRAGDRVKEGEIIAALEDSELRLEKIKAISRLSQSSNQYSEALAGRDRAQAQIYSAQIAEAKANLASTEGRLERSVLKAPFDALIVSGDLTQRVGGSLNQGEELFRLSPMRDHRLVLYVSEYRIGHVELGQRGRVVLSSMPSEGFDFMVESLTPVTEVRDGGTVFRVEGRLEESHALFRPGLVGVAKVEAGSKLLIDIWTIDFRKWLTLKMWSFWG